MGKNLPAGAGDTDTGVSPWVGKIPWRKKWHPTPGFLPGEPHGRRSLVGYSPWGHNESDMTVHTCVHTHTVSTRTPFKSQQTVLLIESKI